MTKFLHIISFDIPYPANYGGVIDVYYKLKALHTLGVRVILHCFQYGGKQPQKHLESLCTEVHYYPRCSFWSAFYPNIPHIIASRNHKDLRTRLLKDNYPILFEGLHCTYFASDPLLKGRMKMLRAHNIESEYYRGLAEQTTHSLKRVYYRFEAWKLKRYEAQLEGIDLQLPISHRDNETLKAMYPSIPSTLLHPFHGNDKPDILPGTGTYCLYHGNLSVEENIRAAEYLVLEVFKDRSIPLIIAGRRPDQRILNLASTFVQILSDPDEVAMKSLIQHAHINVLPALMPSGIKLKLLNALFAGRHCVTNPLDTDPSLIQLIHQAESSGDFFEKVSNLMTLPFTSEDIERRVEGLTIYHNVHNAKTLLSLL